MARANPHAETRKRARKLNLDALRDVRILSQREQQQQASEIARMAFEDLAMLKPEPGERARGPDAIARKNLAAMWGIATDKQHLLRQAPAEKASSPEPPERAALLARLLALEAEQAHPREKSGG